jgi:hypothetical protein
MLTRWRSQKGKPCHDLTRRDVLTVGALGAYGLSLAHVLGLRAQTPRPTRDLSVEESGRAPDRRLTVTAPEAYKAVVTQGSGGGIQEFYDLVADPEAKRNLAGGNRGLFEIGWHGATFNSPPDQPNCCLTHLFAKNREGPCYDGCRDWPSLTSWHKTLNVDSELEVTEKNAVRVRIQAKSYFTWWDKYADKNLRVTATYTFYRVGRIVIGVHVENKGDRTFRWSNEYGPHLDLPGWDEKPNIDPGFVFRGSNLESARPTITRSGQKTKVLTYAPQPLDLVVALSDKVATSFLITVPNTLDKLFDRPMHHDGRDIGWDRCGYGSNKVVMQPGYESTWACQIQMGSTGNPFVPKIKLVEEALPLALQYRRPAQLKVAKGEVVQDDVGDLDADGFNESEGCWVLRSNGGLDLTFPKSAMAIFAPVFKVLGWTREVPKSVRVNGIETASLSTVVNGNLILQVMGTLESTGTKLQIGA